MRRRVPCVLIPLIVLFSSPVHGYYYLGEKWDVAQDPFRLDMVSLPTSGNTNVASLPKLCTDNGDLIALMESTGNSYCAGIVTWDVWANGPFAVTDASSLATADALARSFFTAAKPMSLLNEDASTARPEGSRMQGPCLSYMSYWGCLAAFPRCDQRDPYQAQCRTACEEFNRRCRSTEGPLLSAAGVEVKCDNYPESECSAGERRAEAAWTAASLATAVAVLLLAS
jgi:hypothetical protein